MRSCFICGGSGKPHSYFYFWREHKLDLNWCEPCGVGWVVKLPDSSVFSDAYERLNFFNWKDKTPSQLSKDVKRAYLKGVRVAKAFSGLKGEQIQISNLRVLEVGSNIGVVLKGLTDTLRLKSSQVVGVDFSRNHAEISESKFGIHTLIETLDAAAPKLQSEFDLIICHHIIEHDENPVNFLKLLKKLLKPHGIISFELPNGYREMRCFQSDLSKGVTPRTMVNHINYFTPAGFRKFLRQQEFKIKHLCTLNANKFFYDMGWTRNRHLAIKELPRINDIPNESVKHVFQDQAIITGIEEAQFASRFISATHKMRLHYPDALPLGRDIEAYVELS